MAVNSKNKFAKLFDIAIYQVLVIKEYEPDSDTFRVVQTINIEDLRPSIAISFEKEESCNKCFEDYNEEHAVKFIETIQSMLNG